MQAVRFTEKSRSLRVESEGAKARIDRSWNLRETGPNKHAAHPLSVRWALPNAILRMSVGHGGMALCPIVRPILIQAYPSPGPGRLSSELVALEYARQICTS